MRPCDRPGVPGDRVGPVPCRCGPLYLKASLMGGVRGSLRSAGNGETTWLSSHSRRAEEFSQDFVLC